MSGACPEAEGLAGRGQAAGAGASPRAGAGGGRTSGDGRALVVGAALGVSAAAGATLLARRLGVLWPARRPPFRFAGRVVLVTGGSRGLGLALARRFAAEGARIALCARNPEELERARADLAGRGAEAFAIPCDITRQEEVEAMVGAVRERFGRIDVLVNNAGVISVGPMETMTLDDFRLTMGVHFWGPLYASLAVLPEMRRRGEGRIVNISSIGGKIAVPHLLPYCASKFALVGLSEGMRAELDRYGIAVTTVCPGLMRTGSPRNALFKGEHRAEYTWFVLGDSLPGSSISVERAAAQIVDACRRGDAELILTLPAQFLVRLHGLFPGPMTEALALVNRLLPSPPSEAGAEPGAEGARAPTEAIPGRESETPLTRSWLTALTQRAEREYNQLG